MDNEYGQALIEYLFVLLFLTIIAVKMASTFNDFISINVGSLSYVLGKHLSVGTCSQNCFFSGYLN